MWGLNRYWAVWLFSWVLRGAGVISFISLIIAIIGAIFNPVVVPVWDTDPEVLRQLGLTIQLLIFVQIILWAVGSLALYAFGQFLILMIDISESARSTAVTLRARQRQSSATEENSPTPSVWKRPF